MAKTPAKVSIPNFKLGINKWLDLIKLSKDYVNYRMGALAGTIGGGIVYYINSDYGFLPASGGFGKQFLYNVFVAGFNVKTCE